MKQALINHPKNWNGHHSKKTSRRYHKNKRIGSLSKKMKLKKIEKYETKNEKNMHHPKHYPKMTKRYAEQIGIKEGDYVSMYIKYKNDNGVSRKIIMFEKHGCGHKVEIIN